MGGLNWLGLAAFGAALHWTINLAFVEREGRSLIHLLLYITAWLMILLGVVGPILTFAGGPILVFVALVVFGMAVHQYRMRERLSLLWLLGLAIEKQIPLSRMVRAYARERSDETGWRAERLAELLEHGTPLGPALIASRNPLPTDAQLAVNLTETAPEIGQVLCRTAQQRVRFATEFNSYLNQLLYLTLVSLFGIMALTYIGWQITPTINQIILDFGMQPSPSTAWTFQFLNKLAAFGWPIFVLAWCTAAVLSLHYLGWSRWEPAIVHRITSRYHASIVLRTLGSQMEGDAPLHATIERIANHYPRRFMRRRLRNCADGIARGESWTKCLRGEGLLRNAEADVLSAAERVGNLPWALAEIADGIVRRLHYRLNIWLRLLFPFFVLGVAGLVALTGYAIMEPMQRIALDLASTSP